MQDRTLLKNDFIRNLSLLVIVVICYLTTALSSNSQQRLQHQRDISKLRVYKLSSGQPWQPAEETFAKGFQQRQHSLALQTATNQSMAVGVSKLTYRMNLQTLLPVYMIGSRLTVRDLEICQYSAHQYGHWTWQRVTAWTPRYLLNSREISGCWMELKLGSDFRELLVHSSVTTAVSVQPLVTTDTGVIQPCLKRSQKLNAFLSIKAV